MRRDYCRIRGAGAGISIHAPREGCDPASHHQTGSKSFVFQSTHPARGATAPMVRDCPTLKHFNPRTPRGVRHGPVGPFRLFCDFNPRTPRGVRLEHFAYQPERCYFNPRTPRGVRRDSSTAAASNTKFQSTHPARGATLGCFNQIQPMSDFNPRTPRGVRPDTWGTEYSTVDFNPRTPRGVRLPFLLYHRPTLLYFNPRTPRGVRPGYATAFTLAARFQSTHPARGATANFTKEQRVCLAQFAYLHKGKKAEHTKTNAPMLH